MSKKQYTSEDIQVLSDRDHVRKRLPVYAGSTSIAEYTIPVFGDDFLLRKVSFVPAVYKVIGEIIDNSIDEFAQIDDPVKILTIDAEPISGLYSISDNGRGVPIDKHRTGKYTPEVVFGSLRSGRNFGDDKQNGVIGMNGMGSAITNFCSSEFTVIIHRDGKKYTQMFADGGKFPSKPIIRKGANKTGTTITFTLDDEVFEDVSLDPLLMLNRAKEVALTNPGVVVQYNKKRYLYRKGFEDVVKKIVSTKGSYYKFEHTTDTATIEFFVITGIEKNIDEQVFTWVNSSFLFDGGLCNTQFVNAFVDKTINHLASAAKKERIDITKNDVRQNLLIFGNIKVSNPEYDAQSKTRLTGPNLRNEMQEMISNHWKSFARKNKGWIDEVFANASARHNATAAKKAIKEHKKHLRKKIDGLIDATGKDRTACQLLVTEGLSAASMITEARNPVTTGSFPLTGKINNVYGKSIAQLLNMGKVTDLLASCGLVPGEKAGLDTLRYGKIVIATDADYDGDDIFTLLVNLFYQYWPELFKEDRPIVHRLVAPNVCLSKGKQRVHFPTRDDYEKSKNKYHGWEVSYYKGLGSMVKQDWEMILNGETNTLIPVYDDGNLSSTLELLFSNNVEARKEWLQ